MFVYRRSILADSLRRRWERAAAALILSVCFVAGCDKGPAPAIDPTKTPWLDPKTQMESLKDSNFKVRGLAAFNLGNIGAKAVDAIPELERLAQNDRNPTVRENAAAALEKIRAAAGEIDE